VQETKKNIETFLNRAETILQQVRFSKDEYIKKRVSEEDRGLRILFEDDLIVTLQSDIKGYIDKNELLCKLFSVCHR